MRTALTPARAAWLLAAGLLTAPPARADQAPAPAARCVSPTASLLHRPAPDKPWQVVKEGEALAPGDLILGAADAALESADGAVRLEFVGDLSGTSPFPVLETAVVLNPPDGANLSVTLDRGRIDLTNRKASGPARARVRVGGLDRSAEFELTDPGSRVAVEVYGRWPAGTRFSKEPKPGDRPALAIAVLALKGSVKITGSKGEVTLSAPPGPALIQGDDLADLDPTPRHLPALPEWATGADTETGRKKRAVLAHFRQLVAAGSVEAATEELLKSDDPAERRLAVLFLGATDNLAKLGDVLAHAKHPDVWDVGVLALRHWIGRGPGQDQKLYHGLIEKAGYTPAQAASVVNLLHSFGESDLARPTTYETLIDFLRSDKLALRGLAYWHLSRLVPAGRSIGYNPLAPKDERDRAAAEWRKLIPEGQLPPRAAPPRPDTR
jgi:hypothetical protein